VLEERFPEAAETQPELLAHHYTEAGLYEQAIGYWQQAGQRASERSAYQEASSHLSHGLVLLAMLSETLNRVQQELTLQTLLGQALMMIKGWAAPEVERAYTRARALSQQVEDIPQRFQVLAGLWRFNLTRAAYHTAHELAEQLLWLAESRHERSLLRVAHYTLGMTMLFRGVFVDARTHLEHGIALYNP
jgi:predicted ATPase